MKRPGLISIKGRGYSPIGLDIGVTSIKMAQLKKTAAGWTVSDTIEKEINVTESENDEGRSDAIINIIKDCMKESSFSGRSVVSGMPGYQLDILPVKFSLSGDESLEDAILEKARAHLSYDVENAVIDYTLIEDGETGPEAGSPRRSLLISARREDVDNHLSILKRAKLKPVAMDISACALARVISFNGTEKDDNMLVINVGKLHTSLTLIWRNNILFERNILWGSEKIIETLMNRLKLEKQKATDLIHRIGIRFRHGEETVHENGASDYMNKISETVYEIVTPQLEKLAREIDKVVHYFSSEMMGADIDTLYLSGAVSTIKDLDEYLGERTGIKTMCFDPLKALKAYENGVSKHENGYGSSFGVAVGLAMRGFEDQVIKPERK